ncbi:MAG: proline dehydrogenase family protein [Cyclobacteriaceae bacterium]|nr:proline dehydrogenase family protein [Cyclobacteriaceae bacterium]
MKSNISFADTSIAFSYKSDKELKKSYFLFSSINNPILSKLGANIVKFALKVKIPIKGIIRNTVFQQFCGGESINQCDATIKKLANYNIKTILDYAAEGDQGESNYNIATGEILKIIEKAASNLNIPFCVFKPTGIGSKDLLEKIQLEKELNNHEKEEFEAVRHRYDAIAKACFEKGIQLYVDSEDSFYQDPIDDLVYELMEKYNRVHAVVFNTYQMYRKGMLENLKVASEMGRKRGYYVGAKLVRGAYMEKERERAEEKGYQDPIMPDKESTDRQYDDALRYCVENIDNMELCSGSHNENSNYLLTELILKHNLAKDDKRIYFAQLFGMSDHISFNLANAGYNVVKYVPYGPIETVMPYLLRRAEENTSIAGQSSRELELITKELKRRKAR